MISFTDYKNGKITFSDFGDLIRSEMLDEDYFATTLEQLVSNALSKIDFISLEAISESTIFHARKVLEVNQLTAGEEHPLATFIVAFLGLTKLPLEEKAVLEKQVRLDLKMVQEIIEFYKTLPFIAQFILEPQLPRNHEAKTQLVFYQRALAKKDEIVDYLANGIYRRALERSSRNYFRYRNEYTKESELIVESHFDFPYTEVILLKKGFKYAIDMSKIDYTKINVLWTKLDFSPAALKGEYAYSKTINNEIQKTVRPRKLFDELLEDLKHLPIIKHRRDLFLELKSLFLSKKWYGFFALALPQVEGIFQEMLGIADIKQGSGALPDKVKRLRPHSDNATFSFDYFEYVLPEMRNSFAHSGLVTNVRDKSYHLLLDLRYLLDVALDLNAPIADVARMIKVGEAGFDHIGDFAKFTASVKDLIKSKKIDHLQPELNEFVYSRLLKKLDLRSFLEGLKYDFTESVFAINNLFSLRYHQVKTTADNFFSMSPVDIRNNLPMMEKQLADFGLIIREDLKLLLDTFTFVQHFDKVFPLLEEEDRKQLAHFRGSLKKELKIVELLDAGLTIKRLDNFLIKKTKLKHRTG